MDKKIILLLPLFVAILSQAQVTNEKSRMTFGKFLALPGGLSEAEPVA